MLYFFYMIGYYFRSIIALFLYFNWWDFWLVLFKKPVLINIKNHPSFWVSNFMDIWTLKEVIVDNQYRLGKKKLNSVVDVGASIGDFSIMASFHAKEVIAYECNLERIKLLKKNLKLNKITNVKIIDKPATSVKQLLTKAKHYDLMKIDCEGCEYQVFKNTTKQELSKFDWISMEAHKFDKEMINKFDSLIKTFKQNDFKVEIVKNSVHDNICFVFCKRT